MNFKPLINKLGLGLISYGKRKFQIQDAEKAERRGIRLTNLLYFADKKGPDPGKSGTCISRT
jgi:hypothetical protein